MVQYFKFINRSKSMPQKSCLHAVAALTFVSSFYNVSPYLWPIFDSSLREKQIFFVGHNLGAHTMVWRVV